MFASLSVCLLLFPVKRRGYYAVITRSLMYRFRSVGRSEADDETSARRRPQSRNCKAVCTI